MRALTKKDMALMQGNWSTGNSSRGTTSHGGTSYFGTTTTVPVPSQRMGVVTSNQDAPPIIIHGRDAGITSLVPVPFQKASTWDPAPSPFAASPSNHLNGGGVNDNNPHCEKTAAGDMGELQAAQNSDDPTHNVAKANPPGTTMIASVYDTTLKQSAIAYYNPANNSVTIEFAGTNPTAGQSVASTLADVSNINVPNNPDVTMAQNFMNTVVSNMDAQGLNSDNVSAVQVTGYSIGSVGSAVGAAVMADGNYSNIQVTNFGAMPDSGALGAEANTLASGQDAQSLIDTVAGDTTNIQASNDALSGVLQYAGGLVGSSLEGTMITETGVDNSTLGHSIDNYVKSTTTC